MTVQSNINPNFPIPGIDQSSKGFRDNFTTAKLEIENLQSKTITFAGSLSGTSDPFDSGSGTINFTAAIVPSGLAMADGTSAFPGLPFASDNTTGFYAPGPGELGISTNGTSRITIDASGNVYVNGDFQTVGTTTYVNSINFLASPIGLTLNAVLIPTDLNANGGGLALSGTTPKTITYNNTLGSWNLSEHLSFAANKQILLQDGTATDPSLTFESDTNTGIFRSGAEALSISSNGTEMARFKVDAFAVNRLEFFGSASASGVRIASEGTDPNVAINFAPKGTSGIEFNGTQVIYSRQTGWTAATGTSTRTTFDTTTVTTQQLAERVKALIDDLITHGLIGS